MSDDDRRPRVASAALALLLALPAQGQETAGPPFGEVVDVVLVNVEAWVTDGAGTPVTGLEADDFEVLEDGRPVTVTHFAEVRESLPVVSTLEGTLAPPAEPAPLTPVVDPNHLVIYFDQLHLQPASRNRLIEALRDFLVEQNVPPERVLVLRQERDLATELSFGASWSELDDALRRVASTTPLGGRTQSVKRLAIRSLQDLWQRGQELAASNPRATGSTEEAACGYFIPRAVAEVQANIRESRDRISVTLDHLASVASFLAGVPGVKYLLYLSDQLERAPGSDLAAFVNQICPTQLDSRLFVIGDELSQDFARLTRHANANRVTIYTLHALGLQASVMGGAEQETMEFRGSTAFELALRQNERDGLSLLARETGGRAVFNRNDMAGELATIGREMSSYYSLAYEPPHGGDKGEHRIEVRLKSPGLEVRHRRGYRDKSSDERMAERLQGALYLGLVDNPLGVRLGAGTVQTAEGRRVLVPLHVMVPAESLAFLPAADGSEARLSLHISTRDTRNQRGISAIRTFRVAEPTGGQELVDLVLDLELPPGLHVVAIGVRDDATREASFVSTTLQIESALGRAAVGP